MSNQKFIKMSITGVAGTCRVYAARLIEKALLDAGFPSVKINFEEPLHTLDEYSLPVSAILPEIEIDIVTLKKI